MALCLDTAGTSECWAIEESFCLLATEAPHKAQLQLWPADLVVVVQDKFHRDNNSTVILKHNLNTEARQNVVHFRQHGHAAMGSLDGR